MATFAENLRILMNAPHTRVKNVDLATAIGVDRARVSKWLGGTKPSRDNLLALARHFATTPEALLGETPGDPGWQASTPESNAEPYDRDIVRGYRKQDVPIVGDAEASTSGIIAWNSEGLVRGQIEDWVSRSFADGDPKAYALRVRGDSMVPRYHPGEVVVAQPRIPPRDGDYAVVMLTSGERLIKRVFRITGGWRLHSENALFQDRDVVDAEVHEIHPIRHAITPPTLN